VVEGDAFNAREIRDAEERIRALGYFANATVSVREGSSPSRALVDVEVEEQPTGTLSLGGALSSGEGFSAQVAITERNFLGRGQTLSASISGGDQFSNLSFGFVEPALFDRDLLAGFQIYSRNNDFDEQSFKTTNRGFEPRIGFPVSENGRLTLTYKLASDDIRDVSIDTSEVIRAEEGELITSAFGFTYTYDRRNSPVDPSAGFILTFDQEFAGFGGDVTHSKSSGSARAFTSFFEEEVILSAELEGGAIFAQDDTRITDRFTSGGDNFRGFERNGLGPRDKCRAGQCVNGPNLADINEGLGGNFAVVARFDASFPIGLPQEYGVYGGLFADVGSLWGLDNTTGSQGEIDDSAKLRAAVGVSLFVDTPFAPLRFNFAEALRKVDGDKTEFFRFTVQTRF
jgi:outer membrane protein insertion porin family